MIKSLWLDANKKFCEDLSRQQLTQAVQDKKSVLWVDLDGPDEKDFVILQDVFNFHPLAIEDCLQHTDLPKVDEYEDHLFVIVHDILCNGNDTELKKKGLNMFVSKNYIVTVHENSLKTIESNLEKVKKNPQILSKGADFLLHNLIDVLVDNYIPLIDGIEEKIEELEDRVLNGRPEDVVSEIMEMKRQVLELRRSVSPQRDVINKLSRRDSLIISNKNVVYFRDIYDHMVRVHELVETNRELLASTFEIYLSAISNRMNEIMKRLTIVATIFLPLTLISGIYGMNFNPKAGAWNMPELNWAYGYLFVIGLMLFIALGMMAYFKSRKWV